MEMREKEEETQRRTGDDVSFETFYWMAPRHRFHTTASGRQVWISALSLWTNPGVGWHPVAGAVVVLLASSTSSSRLEARITSSPSFSSTSPNVCLRPG